MTRHRDMGAEPNTWVVYVKTWNGDRHIANFSAALCDAYIAGCGGMDEAIARAPSQRCLRLMWWVTGDRVDWVQCDVAWDAWQRHQWGDIALLSAGPVGAMRAARQCTDSELGAWVEAVRRMKLLGDMSEEWEEACAYIEELWRVAIPY